LGCVSGRFRRSSRDVDRKVIKVMDGFVKYANKKDN